MSKQMIKLMTSTIHVVLQRKRNRSKWVKKNNLGRGGSRRGTLDEEVFSLVRPFRS